MQRKARQEGRARKTTGQWQGKGREILGKRNGEVSAENGQARTGQVQFQGNDRARAGKGITRIEGQEQDGIWVGKGQGKARQG